MTTTMAPKTATGWHNLSLNKNPIQFPGNDNNNNDDDDDDEDAPPKS